MSIGVHDWEKRQKQIVNISVYVDIDETGTDQNDDIANTLSYSDLVAGIRAVADHGHFELVETFAESIASMCLAYTIVRRVQVMAGKPDIYQDISEVGASITRSKHTD